MDERLEDYEFRKKCIIEHEIYRKECEYMEKKLDEIIELQEQNKSSNTVYDQLFGEFISFDKDNKEILSEILEDEL